MLSKCSLRTLMVGLFFAAIPAFVSAQRVQPVLGTIDESAVTTLPDNVSPLALKAADQGSAAGDRVLPEMQIRFAMSAAQEAALDQLLADQQNASSPRYHQWLTPEQFAAQFGMAQADLTAVQTWLKAQGFTVTGVARGGTFIRFSGTVAQADAAFHTDIHNVSLNGEAHIANLTSPALPAAIAAVTAGISGLHDFHPKPHHYWDSVQATDAAGSVTKLRTQYTAPSYTSSSSGNHFIAPGDMYTIYDEKGLISSNVTGSGVTIAVVGQTDVTLSDIATFRSVSGLSTNTPTVTLYGTDPGVPSSDDLIESELDLEWAGAAAPGATVLFVNSSDVIDTSLVQAIDNNLAPIITDSYGACETSVGSSNLNYFNSLFKMANAQGQTIVAAAGDSGATDCDYQVATATQGLAVDFPADLPTVTGVGGTMFSEGTGTYWNASNGTNSGSATAYIPESVWNEDSTGGLGSGGGGASAFFTKPAWQVGTGVPADSSRDVPDVSLNSAASHDGYLTCVTSTRYAMAYCTNGYRDASGFLSVVGGTSVATPSFAGMLAMVVQKTGARLGNANPKLYALANSTYYGNVFHDVTAGSNASPCQTGSTNCPSGGTIGYTATTGFDLASGWGSVDASNLVNDWALVTAIGTGGGQTLSAVTLAANPTSVTQGTAITLTATVASGATGTTTTPTGTVQFQVDGAAVGSAVTLTGGVATYSLATTSLASGGHTVTAAYNGDTTYAGSKGTLSINITAAASADFTLSPATGSITTKSGSTGTATFTVAATNGFSGSVVFTASTTSSSLNATYAFSVDPVVITSTATSGQTVLTLYAFQTNGAGAGTTPLAAVKPQSKPWAEGGAGVALAGLMLLVLPRRRKLAGLLAAVVTFGVLAASGCSAGGSAVSNTTTTVNTTPGTYTVNVTATGTVGTSTVTHTSQVTFVVQ